jgi:hypothetical protein
MFRPLQVHRQGGIYKDIRIKHTEIPGFRRETYEIRALTDVSAESVCPIFGLSRDVGKELPP